jgi:hypothetical protein
MKILKIIFRDSKVNNFLIILLCLFSLLNNSFASQNGSISGYVLDESLEPLPGANIVLQGTNLGVEADEKGYYKLLGVRAGTYTVKYLFIGYEVSEVYNVTVQPDADTEIIICLEAGSTADFFNYDYDGSDAKITPNNSSQKNIALEKTGKADIKEKSKYPNLDMKELFPLLKSGNHLEYTIHKNIPGEYISTENENVKIIFHIESNQLVIGHSKQLFNTGDNRFITRGYEYIFKNDSVFVNITGKNNLRFVYKKVK